MERNFNNLEDLNKSLKKIDDKAKEINRLNVVEIIVNGIVIDALMEGLNIRDWGNKKFKEISWEIFGYKGVFQDKYLFDITIYINY